MATLERAISIAAEAHTEQLDEDCGWTAEGLLAEGFSPEVVDAVLSVSRRAMAWCPV